jgi:hypothetical protein
MDILETKKNLDIDKDLLKIISIIKFKNNNIELKGSSSIKSQYYYSDYDLYSDILGNYNIYEIYNEFNGILKKVIETSNLYFIEFKIQTNDNNKFRWFPNDTFSFNDFKKKFNNVNFTKLDLIMFSDNEFIEISCIYNFSKNKIDKKEFIKNINTDIKELKKENKYYKVLKRKFTIFKIDNDNNKILYLTKIFNGEYGELYKKISNIETILKILEYYKDSFTKKKIEINLTDINEPLEIDKLKNNLNKYKKQLNKESKLLLKNL